MHKQTLTFHSDPGHGWLEVPQNMLPPEIRAKISHYSYQNSESYFLEEDCDAAIALDYFQSRGIEIETSVKHYANDAPMRYMRRM